jgi:hypothetical protein
MLIVRSLDGKLTVGLVRSCGIAHPPKLLDLGYLGTEKKYENTINYDDVERVLLSGWSVHGAPTSGHLPIISQSVQVHSPTGPLPLYLADWEECQ